MRLLRTGDAGRVIPVAGIATASGEYEYRDVGSIVGDFAPEVLGGEQLAALESAVRARLDELPVVDIDAVRIAPPLARIGKVVCIGLNYRRHAAEAGMPVPAEPVVFMKAPDTVVGPNDAVIIPRDSVKTDYEVELAVVIGTKAEYLDDDASGLAHVAGYAISNDVSEREFQLERGGQWDKGKNCATFNPLGPWILTADEVPDPQALRMRTVVNNETRQDSSTADMIFTVEHIVKYVSRFMTLHPGDIINTGTPEGVGSGFTPGRFLRAGDVVEIGIGGLGSQRQEFVAWQPSKPASAASAA